MNENKIRTFDTGATRDTEVGKLNYIKALSPLVLQKYIEYLGKHRIQTDGSLRDWNNWKLGISKQTYIESLARHLVALWLMHEGEVAYDNHGEVTIIDTLNAIIFNAMGYAYEILTEDENVS